MCRSGGKDRGLDPEIETRLYLAAPPPGREDALERALAAAAIASVCAFDATRYGDGLTGLREICHAHGLPLLAEAGAGNAVDLAARYGLDGVHVPATAKTVAHARRALGKDAIVGADAGPSRHAAMSAAEAGADYVAFGPVAGAGETVDPELLDWWALVVETPQVALGGITADSVRRLAGVADFILLDEEIWSAPDPAGALAALADQLSTPSSSSGSLPA